MTTVQIISIIANRNAAGATDRDTAAEQIRVAVEQAPADWAETMLDVARALVSAEARANAAARQLRCHERAQKSQGF